MARKRGGPKSPLTPKQRKIFASSKAIRIAAEKDANPAIGEREAWVARKVAALQQARTLQWPQTLDDIAGRSGPYADTVTAAAKAAAMIGWALPRLSKTPERILGNAKVNSEEILWEVLPRHRAQIWADAGITHRAVWDDRTEQSVRMPLAPFDGLSPESRCEAELVTAETYAEWEAAGSPGLDQPTLAHAFKSLLVAIWKGDLPTFDGCPEQPE